MRISSLTQFDQFKHLQLTVMQATRETTKLQLHHTPIKSNNPLKEKQLNTAQTNSSGVKFLEDVDCQEFFQRFSDYISIVEQTLSSSQEQTVTQRKLEYDDIQVGGKKLFSPQPIQKKMQSSQRQENKLKVQMINVELESKKKLGAHKVQMMTVKKSIKSFETPTKKPKQPKEQVLWATSKKLKY